MSGHGGDKVRFKALFRSFVVGIVGKQLLGQANLWIDLKSVAFT